MTTMVWIVCNADVHDKPVVLREFAVNVVDGEHIVTMLGNQGARRARLHGDEHVPSSTPSSTLITFEQAGGSYRYKMKLTCPECWDRVEVRWERLAPILKVLAQSGVLSVSLTGIRGRLRGN